ncbi:MAG TPA: outer membrane protein assembly factor BamD [Bacteroidia bacterium]|jgi:outer membrane protein assembly factor BamD|nr:outer membrane protein assembly factor BamD [Bacteroidia bacterium]
MKRRLIWLSVSVLAFWLSACQYNRILRSSDYELKFTKAIEYYNKGNYTAAQTLFEELIPVFKGTPRAEEVYYYYTYTHYYLGDYGLAGFHFRTFARAFHNSPHAEECSYMNAFCYYLSSPRYSLDQSDTKNAIQEMQNFVNEFPESKRIDTCNTLIDNLRAKLEKKAYMVCKAYYFRDDWKSAIPAFENFIKDFPESVKVEEFRFLIIKSYFLLAKNSVESKKPERLEKSMDNYLKFVDLHPQSLFLKEAEGIYLECQKLRTQPVNQ